MSGFILETKRCRLREMTPDDASELFRLNQHPLILLFTTDPPFISIDEAREFLTNYDAYVKTGFGRWAIEMKSTNLFAGWCGLKYIHSENEVDIGYRLLPEFWGQGIATETATACLEKGFNDIGLKRIVARVHKENQRSIRVIEKLGMIYEKDLIYDNVPWMNFVICSDKKNNSTGKLMRLPISK